MNVPSTGRVSWFLRRLRDERGGNVIVIFALAAVPLIGIVGMGIDYVRGINYRAHYDKAADAASITAIATVRDYISTNPKNEADPTESAKALAVTRGLAAFRVNAGSMLASLPLTPTLTVTRNGGVVTATSTYSATYPSPFSKVLGNALDIAVSGSSTSSLTLGKYSDFYLLLDTSGSMGFPTSSQAQKDFAKINPDMADRKGNNCAFACHYPDFKGFDLAKKFNVELRIKTVSNAVQGLIEKAKSNQTLLRQYRIGLYPFVSNLETAAALNSDLNTLKGIDLENYMDVGDLLLPRGSGGTHYENIFPKVDSMINQVGDGSAASKTIPFVFLITDGVGNSQYYDWRLPTKPVDRRWGNGSHSDLIDPGLCTPLKTRGITVSVLYIPYEKIAEPFNDNVGYENVRVNALIPDVPKKLQECASPGYFRTASSASEIQDALSAMFDQATKKARLVSTP